MRGKDTYDPKKTRRPILAIEVDVTNTSLPRMPVFAKIGVPEVWRLDTRGQLRFYRLTKTKYEEIEHSIAFAFLKPADLMRFVNRRAEIGENAVVREFVEWAKKAQAKRTKSDRNDMTYEHPNNYPKLHNAAWPGVVGKGPGGEPPIDLDTMLDLTADAEFEGVRFDGFDLFLFAPHIDIDSSDDQIRQLADKARARNLEIGTVVAPVWGPTGGGSAMGNADEQAKFLDAGPQGLPHRRAPAAVGHPAQRRGADRLGLARGGLVRRPAGQPEADRRDLPRGLQDRRGPRRAAGRRRRNLLGRHAQLEADAATAGDGRPRRRRSASRPTWPTRCSTCWATTPRRTPFCRPDFNWRNEDKFEAAYCQLTAALRPWTIDFHVAQNNATVHGSGTHDKTGRHCLPDDAQGKLDIPHHAGYWLRDEKGELTKRIRHICWDGCMFPNAVMMKRETWNEHLEGDDRRAGQARLAE